MTLLGKVFIGAMLILSVLFFGLAAAVNATHNNWRDLVEGSNGLRAKFQASEQVNQQLREEVEAKNMELAFEQASRTTALAALQSQLVALQNNLRSKEADLTSTQSRASSLADDVKTKGEALKALTAEVETLRTLITKTRQDRDQQYTKVVQLTDNVSQLQGELQGLNERRDQLMNQVTMMKSQLDILGINPETPLDLAPEVKGEIVAVGKGGLVEINLGSDDGLREGLTLEVVRGSQYLGRIKVRSVDADKAVCEILDGYRKGFIQPGDRVDSKLG